MDGALGANAPPAATKVVENLYVYRYVIYRKGTNF